MLLLIELGHWEFRLQRHTDTPPESMDCEHLPQPMTVYTPDQRRIHACRTGGRRVSTHDHGDCDQCGNPMRPGRHGPYCPRCDT